MSESVNYTEKPTEKHTVNHTIASHVPSTWTRIKAYSLDLLWSFPLLFIFLKKSPIHYLQQGWVPIGSIFFYILTLLIVEVLFLFYLGATPGKWITGLRIVPFRSKSYQLTLSACIVRVLSFRMLHFLFSLAPFVLVWLRYDRTHLVDWIAETRVIGLKERRVKAQVRPVLAIVLFVVFAVTGLNGAQSNITKIDFSKGHYQLPPLVINFKLDEFSN